MLRNLWRWAVIIQEYEFTIEHRKGQENTNADALSRFYNPNSKQNVDHSLDPLHAESDRVTSNSECDLEHSELLKSFRK